jgi:hypothetical protein
MTGFLVALSPRCLSKPQEIDLRVLEAAMFFPDDANRRDAHIRHAEIKSLIKAEKLLGSKEVSIAVAEEALDVKALDYSGDGVLQRGIKGMIAGWILDQAMARSAKADRNASMKAIFLDASKKFSALTNTSAKTIEQHTWARFKSVAHFWVARRTMEDSGIALGRFPCSPNQIPDFLGIAVAISRKATTISLKQSRWGTIILPQDVAQLPADLNPPEIPISIV